MKRLLAFLVDLGVLGLASAAVSWPCGLEAYRAWYLGELTLDLSLWVLYFGLLEGCTGRTLGKLLAGLQTQGDLQASLAKAVGLFCLLELLPWAAVLGTQGLTGAAAWGTMLAAYPLGWALAGWACWPLAGGVSRLDQVCGLRVQGGRTWLT